MTHAPAKRAFLRGRFKDTAKMRPLGALPAGQFEEACTQCGDCARACPEGIILRDSDGFPVVDLSKGECTFCAVCTQVCGQVCDPPALLADNRWDWRATASSDCLSFQGVACRSCEDSCDQQAIGFRLQTGGRATATIDRDLCVGCGACASQCPAGAIKFTQTQPQDGAAPC